MVRLDKYIQLEYNMQPYNTKRYKVRKYSNGIFIRLPKEASKYEYYDSYTNPVTGSVVYIAVKPSIIMEQDRRIIEEGLYDGEES